MGFTREQFKEWVAETFPDNLSRAIAENNIREGLNKMADYVFDTNTTAFEEAETFAKKANSLATLVHLRQSAAKAVVQKSVLSLDNMPLYCFSIFNDSSSQGRQIVSAVYLDGIFNTNNGTSFKGLKPCFYINPAVPGNQSSQVPSNTYLDLEVAVNNLSINLSQVTQKILWLSVGDSLTRLELLDKGGIEREYWGYPSKVVYNNQRDMIDRPALPTLLSLGHFGTKSKATTYKGSSITVRSGTAAQSGWAGCHYLYHAIRLTSITTSSLTITPQQSYYILGLKMATGLEYSGTETQLEAIRTTIMGKYSCDKNATLYDYMKVQSGWTGANDTYTGSTLQNNNMDTYLEYVLDNPQNPFYSKVKARTTGATSAFSLTMYLNRYKTLADDGATRLVVGTTAGSKVTNANSYDVCTPTHLTFNFGTNDTWLFPHATAAQHAAVVRELSNVVIAEYPSIKVGIFNSPYPGTNFPELFDGGIRFTKSYTSSLLKSNLRAALIANLGVTKTTTKAGNIYFIDAYMFTYPISHQLDYLAESAGIPIDFEEQSDSGVHFGLASAASIGDQITAWLYYSTIN